MTTATSRAHHVADDEKTLLRIRALYRRGYFDGINAAAVGFLLRRLDSIASGLSTAPPPSYVPAGRPAGGGLEMDATAAATVPLTTPGAVG